MLRLADWDCDCGCCRCGCLYGWFAYSLQLFGSDTRIVKYSWRQSQQHEQSPRTELLDTTKLLIPKAQGGLGSASGREEKGTSATREEAEAELVKACPWPAASISGGPPGLAGIGLEEWKKPTACKKSQEAAGGLPIPNRALRNQTALESAGPQDTTEGYRLGCS